MTTESTDVLAAERSTHWNYFEAVICIHPDRHAKPNWAIVQNPHGDAHISASLSLSLWLQCCVPLKVISITETLAQVIPTGTAASCIISQMPRRAVLGSPTPECPHTDDNWRLLCATVILKLPLKPEKGKSRKLLYTIWTQRECSDNDFFSNMWTGDQN